METNAKLELAQKIVLETGCSLFLTGKAGTGKTTFLRELCTKTHKRLIVTAPTGIAAINAGGMTLHSFFQLDFAPFVPGMQRNSHRSNAFSKEKIRIIRGLDLLVIDEISMVRADMLDAVDDVLRRFRDRTLPFGGVQLLLIGDLQQLPPVVVESERHLIESNYRSPYFFDSHALQQLDYLTIELTKVYRQSDKDFIELLNAVRDNRADSGILSRLNQRYIANFNPADSEGYVRLTTHNHRANAINQARMRALTTSEHRFRAKVTGNFPPTSYPAEEDLVLKVGAQVMFIKNDPEKRYFNGMMGKVTDIEEEEREFDGEEFIVKKVIVEPEDGSYSIEVDPVQWENVKFVINEESKEITQKVDGVFSQYPLKPAWAITIHKSQGLTFDRAIIDASTSFSHGQTYVALSRCRTLEGMVLERPLTPSAIINDPTVTGFMQAHVMNGISEEAVTQMADTYALHLATEMFNFRSIFNALEGVTRLYNENFMSIFPQMVMNLTSEVSRMRDTLVPLHDKFLQQLRRMLATGPDGKEQVKGRIKDASKYFVGQLGALTDLVQAMPTEHDNKKVRTKLDERLDLFRDMTIIRHTLLHAFSAEDFEVDRYLELKAEAAFRNQSERKKRKTTRRQIKSQKSADNRNPELYDTLRQWRREKAEQQGVPAYTIMNDKTLLAIANDLPADREDLLCISGIGPTIATRHGEDVLKIVARYKEGDIKG